jgi:hypothetical protein
MSWYPSEGSLFYGNTHNQYDKAYGNKNQGYLYNKTMGMSPFFAETFNYLIKWPFQYGEGCVCLL